MQKVLKTTPSAIEVTMKAIILYMSNHGTTEKVVQKLNSLLGYNKSKIINLEKEIPPPLDEFDTVLIGGSIHKGLIQKKVQQYCQENLSELLTKRVGLFICFMDNHHYQEEFNNSFPEELREHAIAEGKFGGEFIFEKMNLFEKLTVRLLKNQKESISRINYQAINHFAIMITG